mmetsp:Transcript_6801/g.18267  ORF Transcript_6801/g.18267 Transcript_6801/m.18267 type:complete len:231 (-) Transcript_6801:493-1185(-)
MSSGPMWAREGHPASAIPSSNSLFSKPITLSTPSCPASAKPYSTGRPSNTQSAPRARALSTSVPRRMPPSMKTGTRLLTAFTIAGRTSSAEGAKSNCLPPWFDTAMPSTPASKAICTSSAASRPLIMTGSLVMDFSQGTKSQVSESSTSCAKRVVSPLPCVLALAWDARVRLPRSSRFFNCKCAGSVNRLRSSASRRPKRCASTVTMRALNPRRSAVRTHCSTTPRSLMT